MQGLLNTARIICNWVALAVIIATAYSIGNDDPRTLWWCFATVAACTVAGALNELEGDRLAAMIEKKRVKLAQVPD